MKYPTFNAQSTLSNLKSPTTSAHLRLSNLHERIFLLHPLLLIHQLLNLLRLNGDISHQVQMHFFLNDNIIFQTNPYTFFWNINLRPNSKHHSNGNGRIDRPYIVNIQSNMMKGPMQEIFFEGRPFGILVFHIGLIDQIQTQ